MEYITIREIMDNLLDNPLLKKLTLERCVNYAQRFIRIIGIPNLYEEKTATINIENYRGLLPCDFIDINQVRACFNNNYICYRYTTDSFHLSENKNENKADPTYKIQGKVIFTSTKDIPIEISYRAMLVDEEGYPLIPDNSSFPTALELYIKLQCYTTLFDEGKINGNVLQNLQQEYCWAVGQASSELIMPSIDEMESISNMWNQTIRRNNEHSSGFKYNGTKEHWRIH